jgi:hypothetical protein
VYLWCTLRLVAVDAANGNFELDKTTIYVRVEMAKRGICKLCLKLRDLQDSHYLPRSVYKSNRARALKNQNPVALGTEIRQDQEQVTDYVLCSECEQRFNKYGEDWVLARVPHDYGQPFPLQAALEKATAFHIGPGVNLYAGAEIGAFDMDKLVYFASSIFWRGAVHQWKTDRGELPFKVELGNHAEMLRKFLLGEAPFPQDLWLTVIVWPFKQILNAGLLPTPDSQEGWHRYWFYVSGLGFVLNFGDAVPCDIKHQCAQNTSQRVITVERAFGETLWELVREEVRAGQTPELRALVEQINEIRAKENSAIPLAVARSDRFE